MLGSYSRSISCSCSSSLSTSPSDSESVGSVSSPLVLGTISMLSSDSSDWASLSGFSGSIPSSTGGSVSCVFGSFMARKVWMGSTDRVLLCFVVWPHRPVSHCSLVRSWFSLSSCSWCLRLAILASRRSYCIFIFSRSTSSRCFCACATVLALSSLLVSLL